MNWYPRIRRALFCSATGSWSWLLSGWPPVLLGKRANEEDRTPYIGSKRASPVAAALHGRPVRYPRFDIQVDIDVVTIAAVAEIAASLSCELVPCDGGPAVTANAEALVTRCWRYRPCGAFCCRRSHCSRSRVSVPVDDLDQAELNDRRCKTAKLIDLSVRRQTQYLINSVRMQSNVQGACDRP